jgi:hypothetical protein
MGTHGFDDQRISSIQIDEDVAALPRSAQGQRKVSKPWRLRPRRKLTMAMRELTRGSESLSRATTSGDRMNQTEQIKLAGHGRDFGGSWPAS